MRAVTNRSQETAEQRLARINCEAGEKHPAIMQIASPASTIGMPADLSSIPEGTDDEDEGEDDTVAPSTATDSSSAFLYAEAAPLETLAEIVARYSTLYGEEDYSHPTLPPRPPEFSTDEAYDKFLGEKRRTPAPAETAEKALEDRRKKLAEQKAAASAEALAPPVPEETMRLRAQAHLFADEAILLNDWVRLMNFKVATDKRCWPINPLSALNLCNFNSCDGSAVEFQHLLDEASDISDEHEDCMTFEITPEMRDELMRNTPASYDRGILQVTRYPKRVEQFYDVIYRHWGEAYHKLRRETRRPEQLEIAYNNLLIFLEEHKKAALMYVRLFEKMASPYLSDEIPPRDLHIEVAVKRRQARNERVTRLAGLFSPGNTRGGVATDLPSEDPTDHTATNAALLG